MFVKDKFQRVEKKFGRKGVIAIFLYPLIILPMTMYALLRSLLNIVLSLLNNRWSNLTGNNEHIALNNYFYIVQHLNINRFGRYGTSPFLSASKGFSLKVWFHVMPFSLRVQARMGTVAMIFFAMLFWILGWFVYVEPSISNFFVIFLAVFSTYFFANFVDGQNYNVLAWMCLPLAFFTLFEQSYYFYAALLFFMSFCSFTAIFVMSAITAVIALYNFDFYLILAFIPAGLKVAIPVLVTLSKGGLKKVGGTIGVHDDVKYVRQDKKITLPFLLTLFFNLLFSISYFYLHGVNNFLILQLTISVLFVANSLVSRFADTQTFYILFLSVFCFSMLLNKDPDFILFCTYFLAINPLYFILGYHPLSNPVYPNARTPVNTAPVLSKIAALADLIEDKGRTLFLFENPQGKYDKLFSGGRPAAEPFYYVFQTKDLALFPDWYYVFEKNSKSDTDLIWWNNSVEQLKSGIALYQADYILTHDEIFKGKYPEFLEEIGRVKIQDAGKYYVLCKIKSMVS